MKSNNKTGMVKKSINNIAIALGVVSVLGGAVFGMSKAIKINNQAKNNFLNDLKAPSEMLENKLIKHITENSITLSSGAEIELTGINYNFGKSMLGEENKNFDIYGKINDHNLEYSFNAKYTAETKLLNNFSEASKNIRKSTYQKYVQAVTELFEHMELVNVYVNQGEAVHSLLNDNENKNALVEIMENRHQKVTTEVNARFIDESQIITPIFERTYTVEEDNKTYAVLHLDFEEKQITEWSSYKKMNGRNYYMKKDATNYFVRSEIFKVEIEPNQNLERDQILNIVLDAAKEKNPALSSQTDFMTKGSDSYVSNATQYLNEAREKAENEATAEQSLVLEK